MGRRPVAAVDVEGAEILSGPAAPPSAASIAAASNSEPFAREARLKTEMHALNR